MSRAGVRGPLFISVGKPAQLDQFLNLNPELRGTPRLLALIDDSTAFDAYRRAGFNYNMGDMPLKRPPPFKPPTMAPGKWLSYLGNVAQLAPAKTDLNPLRPPEGVLVLGGTFAIRGDDVVFAHMDEVPGATPDIETVLASVGA
jgi:hypothetical protein